MAKSIYDLINEYDARREIVDVVPRTGYAASPPLIVEQLLYGRLHQDLLDLGIDEALPVGISPRSREALGIYIERWTDARTALEEHQAVTIHVPLGRIYEQS